MTSNDTDSFTETIPPDKKESLTIVQSISLALYCVIFVVGITGNSLVIYVTGFKMKTTVKSVWFLNLALADFLFTLFLIFNIIVISLNYKWPFGDFMCKFNSLVQLTTMFASIFLLTTISLDRCLSVYLVIWSHTKRTPQTARYICVFVWVFSLGCSIPLAMTRSVNNNNTNCMKASDPLTNRTHVWFRFVVGFVIPFIVITCCYVAIGVRASQRQRNKRLRPYIVILTIILTFFICWLPMQICDLIMRDQIYIFYHVSPQLYNSNLYDMARSASTVAVSLAFLNSSLNPFLYMFMCEEFKQKLKRSVFLVLEHAFAEDQLASSPHQPTSSHHSQRKVPLDSLMVVEKKSVDPAVLTPQQGENICHSLLSD